LELAVGVPVILSRPTADVDLPASRFLTLFFTLFFTFLFTLFFTVRA
jgi:hypothetical protein